MKKLYVFFILFLLFSFQTVSAQSGTCGTNVKYTISGNTITFTKGSDSATPVYDYTCTEVFRVISSITKVKIGSTINLTANAGSMFSTCKYVTEMDLSKLNTSNVTNMRNMFGHCSKLASLNVSGWNTSNVTDMWGMFSGCYTLTSLDVSNWDTSNVTDMGGMFSGCYTLTSLDVIRWNTSNVTDMGGMFNGCSALTSLDLSGWNTSNVTDMGDMFASCTSLTSLNLSGWNTSNVTDMEKVFYRCFKLTSLNINGWDTSNVTNMWDLFEDCRSLTSLDVSGWNTSNVTYMGDLFNGCYTLTSLDVSNWDTSNVTDMGGMFNGCYTLTSLDVSNWDTSNVTDMEGMFSGCYTLTSLDVSNWDTSNVTDMGGMFHGCYTLTSLDVSRWNTSNVTDMRYMFYKCSSLTSLDVSGWNTSNVTDMDYMFYNCSSLTSLDLRNWNTAKVSYSKTFIGCESLKTLTLGEKTLAQNIFETLPAYNDTWYYVTRDLNIVENPLGLGSSRSNGALFESYTYDTMAGTWTTDKDMFVIPWTADQYLIKVVDRISGDAISGAAVTWTDQTGTQTGTSDENGIVFFNAFSYRQPVITVQKANYITWSNEDIYWEKSTTGWETIYLYLQNEDNVKLKLKSARYSQNQDMSRNTNLLTMTKKVSLGNEMQLVGDLDDETFYLACSAQDPSAVSYYELWQGNKKINTKNITDGFFELNIKKFSKGSGCFVRAYGTNGAYMDTAINLVFDMAEKNEATELSFNGKKISIPVADTVPYVGGANVDIDLNIVKLPVTGLISKDKLQVGFNVNLEGGKSPKEQLKEVKKFTEQMKRMKGYDGHNGLNVGILNIGQRNKYKSLIKNTNEWKFFKKGEINFLGYAEGDWSSGKLSGCLMIMGKIDIASYDFNTWVYVVPVTVQVKFSADGTAAFEISYSWKNNTLDGNVNLNATLELEVFGGIGVSKLAGGGAYGSAELEGEFEIIPAFETDKVDLTGELGIKVYIGTLSYERPFAYNTWHLYSRTKPKEVVFSDDYDITLAPKEPSGRGTVSAVPSGIYDASQYHRADFSYLHEEVDHMRPEEQNSLASKAADEVMSFEKLMENTYRNAQPVMISADGAAYAAFLRADTNGRVYAVVSKNSGSGWAAPVEVNSSDVLADRPILLADSQNRVWLAYTRTGSAYDGSSLANWANSQELVVGLVDPNTLSFTPYQVYSGLNYIHMQTFALVNGAPTLVWLSSQIQSDNDVLWPRGNSFYRASLSGSAWSNAAKISQVNYVVTELAAGGENGSLSIAFVMDNDNNYETSEDRALIRYANGTTQTLSSSASSVSFGVLPGTGSAGFIWNDGGTLHSSNGASADLGIFSGEYQIIENNVYYSAATENGAELCLSRYENGTWSQPIFLTEGEGYLENLNAARINSTDYVLGMYTTPAISANDVQDSKDLVWSSVSSVSDIVIEGVDYDDEALQPGQTAPVTLTIRNAGDHPVTSIDIQINDQNASAQSINLRLGESAEIIPVLTIPSEMQTFRLTVTESGHNDYRPEDNEVTVSLGCADLTVGLEWEQIGESTKVAAVVQNVGIAPSAGKLSLLDLSGTVLTEKYFGEVSPGDKVIVDYTVDWEQIPTKHLDVRAVVESFDGENVLYNNDDSLRLDYMGYKRIDAIDITLPSQLLSIGEEAFAGCTFSTIVIPNGVTSIGERAFANCPNLKQIDIPASVTTIAENAFEGTNGFVIYCAAGSDAESFAYLNDIYYLNQ